MKRRPSIQRRGFSLLEVMVSVAIIAMIGTLILGAFRGMSKSRDNISIVSDRSQQGRQALDRMAREVGAAFISGHENFSQLQNTRKTAFIGTDNSSGDRLDFTSFAHQRLRRDSHESDQCEISYFLARDPDSDNIDLVRRVQRNIDDDPQHGGMIQVMAENVESFELSYLDGSTGEWLDTWDSTHGAGQFGRLPSQVWATIMLGGGLRKRSIKFTTKMTIAVQLPLTFATQ